MQEGQFSCVNPSARQSMTKLPTLTIGDLAVMNISSGPGVWPMSVSPAPDKLSSATRGYVMRAWLTGQILAPLIGCNAHCCSLARPPLVTTTFDHNT